MKPVFFDSAPAFRRWLAKHHAASAELLVGFYKSSAGRGLVYRDALDAALCYGWIDGVRKRIDEKRYSIRFTPRRPGSNWSAVNITRARELEADGAMHPSGLRAFHERDKRKDRQYSYERAQPSFDPAFESRLRGDRAAAAFFDAQPAGYRRLATFWVMSAKKDETRARRFARLLEKCAAGKRLDLLNPNR